MALQILSDLDHWREIGFTKADDGGYDTRADAYAIVVSGSMVIGMGEITEKTVEKYWQRLRAYEIVSGAWLTDGEGNDVPITLDMVRRYIGVRTNVFPMVSDAKFASQLGRSVMERISREKRFAEYEAEQAAKAVTTVQ